MDDNSDEKYDIRLPLKCDYLTRVVNLYEFDEDIPFNIKPDTLEESQLAVPVLIDKICVFPGQILPIMGCVQNIRYNTITETFFQAAFLHDNRYIGIIPYSEHDNHFDHKRGGLFKLIGYASEIDNYFSVKLVCCYLFRTKECIKMQDYPANLGKLEVDLDNESLSHITIDIMNDSIGDYCGSQYRIFRNNPWPLLIERMKSYIKEIGLPEKEIEELFSQSPARISYYFAECLIVSYEEKLLLFNSTIEGRVIGGLRHIDTFNGLYCKSCDHPIAYNKVCLMCITGVSPYFYNRHGFCFRTLSLKTDEEEDAYDPFDCWYPDYGWYIRHCDRCNSHLGWLYKNNSGKQPLTFAGMAMENVQIKRVIGDELIKVV